ncbi:MAG: urate hydroxylase PuuD [Candidatus Eutrophobiaceae bacterium]
MNPLKSVHGTLACGFALAICIAAIVGGVEFNKISFIVWLHAFFGIIWVGLLYYFNFIQIPAVAEAIGDKGGPGPAAINKYIAPRALWWFRWGAVATWLTGAAALEMIGVGLGNAFLLKDGGLLIGIGAWLGTIMLLNVWGLIWPNQKKILGLVEASEEEKVKAKFVALMASRTNTLLSIPMLMSMVGHGHVGFFI